MLSVQSAQTATHQSHPEPKEEPGGNFEVLLLKHDRADSACEFRRKDVCDNEMYGNTVLPGMAY